MKLQTSVLLMLLSMNVVRGGEGYYPERYQKQSNVKGPPFLPFIAKSHGKLLFLLKRAKLDSFVC